ncbi:MAG: C10 family peptidase [Muribaculaceae bacterium]|nr:C10 family peptidase [Muribaculaceae bacterium]
MVKHFFKMLIFPLWVFTPGLVEAATVSDSDARAMAEEFYAAGTGDASPASLELCYTGGTSTKPLYYVFNATDGKGFVIVSADDNTEPIIGFSFENPYVTSDVPPTLKYMMDGIGKEIEAASKIAGGSKTRRMARARAASLRVNHGITAQVKTPEWRQEAPFNSMIPGNPLVGCVGTAMAEIMKFYNHPAQGTGSYDGVNFAVEYDWANMRTDNYRYGYSQAEADAVGTLLYHTSKSILTQYGYSGSSAYEVRVPAAMSNYFGYDPGISFKKRSDVSSQQEWDNIIKTEIQAGRPVLYCGQDVSAGHAFVCDGYQQDQFDQNPYFHFNWGWGGLANGWFMTSNLCPQASHSYNFGTLNTIIYNIKPATGATQVWSPIHITADEGQPGMGSDMTDLAAGKTFTVRVGNMKNLSYTQFDGKIAVALYNAAGTLKTLLSGEGNFHLAGMNTLANGYIQMSGCVLPAGVTVEAGDMVRMATKANGDTEWLPVAGELYTVNEISATRTEPEYFAINLPATSGVTVTGENRVIRGFDYSFKVVPDDPANVVVTVKTNGNVLTPGANYAYRIGNVTKDQTISIFVQNASDVLEKRTLWVNEPGTLSTLLDGGQAATLKDLTLFGNIDARDFAFIKSGMKLTRLDLSGVNITAYQDNEARAIPREAFRNVWCLKEVILPNNLTKFKNGCFRSCGITSIVIPASVTTYEYNAFNGSDELRDIWVKNPKPAFVNWCVFHGTPKTRTVHLINAAAAEAYRQDKYWNQPDVDTKVTFTCPQQDNQEFPVVNDFVFAVMDNADVRFDCNLEQGRYPSGTEVSFTAEHIADNDNRMDVYANSTLLTVGADGKYHTTIKSGTIIHFDLVEPSPVGDSSFWNMTTAGGSVGLFTEAVNVIPGQEFTVRINAVNAPADYPNAFWALVLTDKNGSIKEFISPVSNYSSAAGNLKFTVKCCVKTATVREGNYIAMVTSFNKKTWYPVGSINGAISKLPALNNQTPVYNFTFPEDLAEKANLSGVVESAARGKELTFKITPKTNTDRISMIVNDKPVAQNAPSVTYSFVAMEDLNFDIQVISPNTMSEVTYSPGKGLLKDVVTSLNIAPKVIITGEVYPSDLFNTFRQTFVNQKVKVLDLSQATILWCRWNGVEYAANTIPPNMFMSSSAIGNDPVIEQVILPENAVAISAGAFYRCSHIKEMTLPVDLVNYELNSNDRYYGGLAAYIFSGCTSLTTLYVPCAPKVVDGELSVHHFDYSGNYNFYTANRLSVADPKKITVVVKPEYLEAYQTIEKDLSSHSWHNGWKRDGYNIVSEYPVYSLSFDPDRLKVADKTDTDKAASFLGDNVSLETLTVNVYSARTLGAGESFRAFDNGKPVELNADGSIPVVYYNPNKHADLSGNHEVSIEYLFDVTIKLSSENFKVVPDQSSCGAFSYYNPTAPEMIEVPENTAARFRLEAQGNLDKQQIEPKVKVGNTVIEADSEGYYNIEVTDAPVTVEVYAIPVEGATLKQAELDAVDASEAQGVTTIALSGDIAQTAIDEVVKKFTDLETLDLSDLSGTIAENTFAGMTSLKTVVLPSTLEGLPEGIFNGCENLSSVEFPSTVNAIGSQAFAGCRSLTALSLQGIRAIGSQAFTGCDRLMTIYIAGSASTAAAAPGRRAVAARTATEYAPDAFAGLSPNCVIILGDNVAVPEGVEGNFIATITNGTERSYINTAGIEMTTADALAIPYDFTVAEGSEVSIECATGSAWTPFICPFASDKVMLGDTELIGSSFAEDDEKAGFYTLITAGEGDDIFVRHCSIEANRPYFIKVGSQAEATIRIIAKNGTTVSATKEDVRAEGSMVTLTGVYSNTDIAADSHTFVLSDDASELVSVDSSASGYALYDETTGEPASLTLAPFTVYAQSNDFEGSIPFEVSDNLSTGIEALPETGIVVTTEGGILTVTAGSDSILTVYGVDGRIAATVELRRGANTISGLAPGVYIIDGIKVVL